MPAFINSDRGSSFMSRELREFATSKGVSTSRTTPYSPSGNGQVERNNGVIWKGISLSLRSKDLPLVYWQEVLPDVLHSVHSLLCTARNSTPHERLFGWARRSTTGNSLPSWLTTPGPVLRKRHVRNSKMDPSVEEVGLIEANPPYAYISFPNGRQSKVAAKHLALTGERSAPMDFAVGEENESFTD